MDEQSSSVHPMLSVLRYEGHQAKFLLDDPLDEVQRHIVEGQFYELEQLVYHRSLIPRHGRILDVGANIGNHTIFYALICRAELVVAVEPNKRASDLLQETIRLNAMEKSVELAAGMALGDVEGWGVLDQQEALHHNLGGVSIKAAGAEEGGRIPIRTGDAILKGRSVDFVKIDVEGNELAVLAGLKATIDIYRPNIAVEIVEANRRQLSTWCSANEYRIERTFQMYRGIINYICIPY